MRCTPMNIPEPADKKFVLFVRGNIAEARARARETLGLEPEVVKYKSRGAAFERQAASRRRVWTEPEIIEAIQSHAREHDGCPPTADDWMYAAADHPTYSRVGRVCGSWPDAIEKAGFPRPRRGRRILRVSERTSSIA